MEENRKECPEEKPAKSSWQNTKESWYDHLNVTVKQLDIIIGICVTGLIGVFIYIVLAALGIC